LNLAPPHLKPIFNYIILDLANLQTRDTISTIFLLFIKNAQLTEFGIRITSTGTASFIIEATDRYRKVKRETLGLNTTQTIKLAIEALSSLKYDISHLDQPSSLC